MTLRGMTKCRRDHVEVRAKRLHSPPGGKVEAATTPSGACPQATLSFSKRNRALKTTGDHPIDHRIGCARKDDAPNGRQKNAHIGEWTHGADVVRAQFAFQRHDPFTIEPCGVRNASEQFALVAEQHRGESVMPGRTQSLRRAAIESSKT